MRSRRPVSLVSLIALAVFGLSLVMPGTASAGSARKIGILDRCDPATFNALFGEGICVMRNSGVPVDTFLARVNPEDGGHNAWRFTPGQGLCTSPRHLASAASSAALLTDAWRGQAH